MSGRNKLNVLLALTETLGTNWKKNVEDFVKYFRNNQGEFKGVKKTYTANEGTADEPSKRQNTVVVTTVDEKIKWFEENQAPYIDALLSLERTNASGTAKAHLVIEGVDFGEFTSLELLRIKSLIESGELYKMYEHIPVRSDSEIWSRTDNPEYTSRNIWQTALVNGKATSIKKEPFIIPDPNLTKENAAKYTPQVAQRDIVMDLGSYTVQHYSGEYSHLERANILKRRHTLLLAVTEALKKANEAESIESNLKASTLFNYLHRGSLPQSA